MQEGIRSHDCHTAGFTFCFALQPGSPASGRFPGHEFTPVRAQVTVLTTVQPDYGGIQAGGFTAASILTRPAMVEHTVSATPIVCLASMSPRRRELLLQIGVSHKVLAAHIDESIRPDELPHAFVARLARIKALTVRERGETLPVLAADTTVVLDGALYGKPVDRADAFAMLAALSGRTHDVLTAVALATEHGVTLRVSCSSVAFRNIERAEMEAYW
ncbi:MAG: Maf family protein, partial [Steroidobacteraceae bacterium]